MGLIMLYMDYMYYNVPQLELYGGFLYHRGTPSHHPNFHGIFQEVNHPMLA